MLQRKILSLSNLSLFESETIFSQKKYFRKKKINYCYGFMPSNFQVICGSMVGKNRQRQTQLKSLLALAAAAIRRMPKTWVTLTAIMARNDTF